MHEPEATSSTTGESAADAVRASRARIVASSNATRRDLERRLHEGPQQHLVSMAVKLNLIEDAIDTAPDDARRMLQDLREEMQATVHQLRDIASAIFPPLLGDRGLAEALRAAAAREGGWAEIVVDDAAAGRYPIEVEAAAYFAAIEALHHAEGPISLTMRAEHGGLVLVLRGVFDPDAFVHLQDRVHTVGGTAERVDDRLVARIPAP